MVNYQQESPRRARVILSDHCDDDHELLLSEVVYVIGGPFPDPIGYPHWLVVRPEDGSKAKVVSRVRFE